NFFPWMKFKLVIFFTLFSFAYVGAQDRTFIVSVNGMPEGSVAVLSYRDANYERRTDTVKAVGGHSKFTGCLLEPHLANIQFRNDTGKQLQYQNFFLSNDTTTVGFDAINNSLSIQGGSEQVIYEKLNSMVRAAKDTF